jgi:iron uptake system EfeUOB component EfeO/EfeM
MRTWRAGFVGACALAAATVVLVGCGSGGGSGSSDLSSSKTEAATTSPSSTPKITTVVGSSQTPQEAADSAMNKSSAPGPPSELSPLPASDFDRPIAEYRTYAVGQAHEMETAVSRLAHEIAAGDRDGARQAWLDAYDRYLRLGAAYGALGDLDGAINGRPGSLPGGVEDPEFTGLHRVEYGLWGSEALSSLEAPTATLAADVAQLPAKLATMETTPLEYATRAHEILEDAQRDMLSGTQAPWSGAGLRATADSLAATEEVVSTLKPILAGREDALPHAEVEMAAFGQVLAAVKSEHGGEYPTLAEMSQTDHERVDGALGSLLERLAAIPGSLETEPPPEIPTIEEQEAQQ